MLQRMLVDKIENRILVGTVMLVGIMLMIGWVAINENARMASFTRQYDARAIEHGAGLFAASCSTCHNNDGRGIEGRAPALNNPQFFGHDFMAADRKTRDGFQNQITTLNDEKVTLQTELADASTTDARKTEIETRVAEIDAQILELQPQLDEVQARIDTFATTIQTAIDKGYNPDQPVRLAQANWGNTVDTYIFTTLEHGRGQNAGLWGGNYMAAWSQTAGGPLRDDQLRDLVAYIKNWDKGNDWTVEDLLAVNQFAIVPGATGGKPEPTGDPAGKDVTAVMEQVNTIAGNAARGDELYHNKAWSQIPDKLGCSGCHQGGVQAPQTEGTWDRIVSERLIEPQFAGYTPEQYIVESILLPGAYVAPGYNDGVMPQNFGERTSVQDLADIIAYLHTTSADYVPPAEGEAISTEAVTAPEEATATEEATPTP